jgi:hypothetical protein
MTIINENAIIRQFHNYLQEYKIQEAVDALLQDCVNEDLSEDELENIVGGILIPRIVLQFAEHYSEMDSRYDYDPSEDNLNDLFETFCSFEHLSEDLADAVAIRINTLAEEDNIAAKQQQQTPATQDSDDEDDNNSVVFHPDDWSKLSDEQRRAKVKAFLKKLSRAHIDMADLKPFIKNLNVGDQSESYGVKVGEKVKVFDREANRYGHEPNEGIQFPNLFHQDNEDPRSHPLHQTLVNHAYEYSHTTPVTQRDGSTHNHHTWHNSAGHQISAYANDTKWSSKVSSGSGHVWSGIGTKVLDAHLKTKAKRYRLQNNEAVAHINILENILNPESQNKVQQYSQWMKKNPATAFGTPGTYDRPTGVNDLFEGARMRKEHDKKFKNRKKRRNWKLPDLRQGQPK